MDTSTNCDDDMTQNLGEEPILGNDGNAGGDEGGHEHGQGKDGEQDRRSSVRNQVESLPVIT